jgi:hypothetical protein
MEFKGTKGKWEVTISNEYCGDYSIKNENGSATSFEDEANALLISKAPEMLEMLNKVCKKLKGNGFPMLQEEIEQLIKEATTI